jgi:glycerophosphoryl diester phosphodiesterase
MIIGHRGYSARYPENTLLAFEAAYAAGADMIELDVTLSRDRQVVVMHDAVLDRTTEGSGPVSAQTLDSLKRLDAGGWFHPRFSGQRIPTLAEVLERFRPEGLINVEIKAEAFELHDPEDGIERQVVAMLESFDLMRQVLISSFEMRILTRLHDRHHPPLGVLSGRRTPPDVLRFCRDLGAFSWHPHCRGLEPRMVAAARKAGLRVFPYTANAPADIRRLLSLGVDGFFTDDPQAAVKCVAEMRQRSDGFVDRGRPFDGNEPAKRR